MTRILFAGAPVEAVTGTDLDYKTKFDLTGKNTGNLLIGCSLRRQLAHTSYKFGTGQNPATVNQEFDLIAIPAANFIFKGFDFGYLADFLEKTTLPMEFGDKKPLAAKPKWPMSTYKSTKNPPKVIE